MLATLLPEDVRQVQELDGAERCPGQGEVGVVRVRVLVARGCTEGGTDLPLGDPVGEEHHIGRAARILALLVVVSSNNTVIVLLQFNDILSCPLVCSGTCTVRHPNDATSATTRARPRRSMTTDS